MSWGTDRRSASQGQRRLARVTVIHHVLNDNAKAKRGGREVWSWGPGDKGAVEEERQPLPIFLVA